MPVAAEQTLSHPAMEFRWREADQLTKDTVKVRNRLETYLVSYLAHTQPILRTTKPSLSRYGHGSGSP